jgi:hypothetical protein
VPYEPARFRGGGVGTDQLQKVWPRSQRYSRYCLSSRELPVGDAGAWQKVQRRPLTLMCAPYSQRAPSTSSVARVCVAGAEMTDRPEGHEAE